MSTAADQPRATEAQSPLCLGGLAVEGPDAATFLQGYLTSDTERLKPAAGQRTALTTLKGRVLANGWAVSVPNGVALLLADDLITPVAAFLQKYLAFSKSTARTLSSDEVERLRATVTDLAAPRQPLPRQLFEARLPLVTGPTSDQFLPQMLGLTDAGAVDFAKGCYLGQEIVARAEHRGAVKRRLFAFEATNATPSTDSPLPAPGDPITSGEPQRSVGTVVLVDAAAAGDCRVLAVVSADAVATDSGPPPPLSTGSWTLALLPDRDST